MKNKKGFVFLESVIVLVVVALALTGFMTTYRVLSNNAERRETYDKTSDKYLLYAISSLGTDGNNNLTTCGSSDNVSFNVNKDNAYDRCFKSFYKSSADVERMFNETGLVYLYYIRDISSALLSNASTGYSPTKYFDNGVIEYIKTLDTTKSDYLIGVFRRSDKYYYSSINL